MTRRSEGPPATETDDRSILTPDVGEGALRPEPAPTGEPPNVTKLANLKAPDPRDRPTGCTIKRPTGLSAT